MKKSIKITMASLFVASIFYGGAWKYYSVKFRVHIEERLAEVHSRGFDVSFDYARVTGFPFGFDVNVKSLDVKQNGVFHTWVEGVTVFSSKIWKPQEVSIETEGIHFLDVDEFHMEGKGLHVHSFVFDPMRMKCAYDQLMIAMQGQPFMSGKQLDIDVDLTPIDTANAATFKMRLFDWDVESLKGHPLGATFENIKLDLNVKGYFHGDSLKSIARNWYEEDVVIDVNELSLKWGKVSSAGSGSIVLDEALQPMAAFSLKIANLNEGIDIFRDANIIEKRTAKMLKAAAGLFRESDCHKVSFSVQNKKLYIASIPVMVLPELLW